MPPVLAWWRRRSRRAKARLVAYPALVGALGGFLAYAMVMPGRSHQGPLPALDVAGSFTDRSQSTPTQSSLWSGHMSFLIAASTAEQRQ